MATRAQRSRRFALITAFYASVLVLLGVLLNQYLNPLPSHQSAYGQDWDDLSSFRDDIQAMGIDTKSLVSSPLLLEDVDDPANTVVIIAGVERDAFDLPNLGQTDLGLDALKGSKGYSVSELNAMIRFVDRGGSILVMDDFGFASSVADAFGIDLSGARLFDEEYAVELDSNYTWLNMSTDEDNPDEDQTPDHTRWATSHPCARFANNNVTISQPGLAGLCAHRWNSETRQLDYDPSFHMLMNTPSAFRETETSAALTIAAMGHSSQESALDINGDNKLLFDAELAGQTVDVEGPFDTYIEACDGNCSVPNTGRIYFISDASTLINAMYDYEGYNNGTYTEGRIPDKQMPVNDNRMWALDFIAESLLAEASNLSDVDVTETQISTLQATEGMQVIFEESRHGQQAPLGIADAYNFLYYILVYFTSDSTAMLLLFLILFIIMEGVLIRKKDPEDWKHVFSVIYYGFGDATRYGYYNKPGKIRSALLQKVRNSNGLSVDEFDRLSGRDLQEMIKDPLLVKFVFEDRDYSLEQLVTVIKRVKSLGKG